MRHHEVSGEPSHFGSPAHPGRRSGVVSIGSGSVQVTPDLFHLAVHCVPPPNEGRVVRRVVWALVWPHHGSHRGGRAAFIRPLRSPTGLIAQAGAHGLRNAATCHGRACGRGTAVRSPARRRAWLPCVGGG
jgi:hypothetical protein